MRVHSIILSTRQIVVMVVFFVLIGIFIMPGMASDRFTDHGNGTVTDTETGLMWAAKDNGIPINWSDALSYCQNYSSGRHTDWRCRHWPNSKVFITLEQRTSKVTMLLNQ